MYRVKPQDPPSVLSFGQAEPRGFDVRRSSAILHLEHGAVRHEGADEAPATAVALDPLASTESALFHLERAPAGAELQVGLCTPDHLLENALGWAHSCGVGLDGRIRRPRGEVAARLGRLGAGDTLELRVARGAAYFRLWPDGPWNGEAWADPQTGAGGIGLPRPLPLFPAIYLEQPGSGAALVIAQGVREGAAPLTRIDPRGTCPHFGVQP